MSGSGPSNVDLVFEGGGVKGIALVGALSVLEDKGYVPQNSAGASAGAIVATLLASGYRSEELHGILKEMNFQSFMDRSWEDRIPLVGSALSVLLDQGIYEGTEFLEWMREKLVAKNVEKFADLVHPDFKGDPKYGYKVQVIVSDLTEQRLLVLPKDAEVLGVTADELDVAEAVRMSMSIPVFFEPVRWKEPKSGKEHVLVDGGMLSNFPVWLFDSNDEPDWPTFGLRLVEPETRTTLATELPDTSPSHVGVRAVVNYLWSLVGTMMAAHDRLYIEQADYARTIPIPVSGVKATDFDLSPDKAEELYEAGRGAASRFFDDWDFDEYIAAFRTGRELSRRRQMLEYMKSAASDT